MNKADKRVVVCGFGAITSVGELGANKETFWSSLKRGKSGFQPLTEHFADLVVNASVRDIKATTVVPVRDFDPARYLRPDFLKDYRRLDPVILYGLSAGALAMGMGSRALFQRAQEQAYFISAVNTLAQGRMVPVPGGVLIQDGSTLLGAIGVSGDTSDNDEICAVAGIEAAGLKANAG